MFIHTSSATVLLSASILLKFLMYSIMLEPAFMGTISIDVEKDKKIAELMSEAWISFAKTGKPETALTGKWEAYTRESGAVMILDEKSFLTHHHDEALLKLLAPEYEW